MNDENNSREITIGQAATLNTPVDGGNVTIIAECMPDLEVPPTLAFVSGLGAFSRVPGPIKFIIGADPFARPALTLDSGGFFVLGEKVVDGYDTVLMWMATHDLFRHLMRNVDLSSPVASVLLPQRFSSSEPCGITIHSGPGSNGGQPGKIRFMLEGGAIPELEISAQGFLALGKPIEGDPGWGVFQAFLDYLVVAVRGLTSKLTTKQLTVEDYL